MKILAWNCRGSKTNALKAPYYSIVGLYSTVIALPSAAFLKPKLMSLDWVRSIFGHDWGCDFIPAVGQSGGIVLTWRKHLVNIQTVWVERQVLFGVISDQDYLPWLLAAVYASN